MRATFLLAVVLAAAVVAGVASAVPRGKNGPIYFENFSDTSGSGDIWVIKPDGTGLTDLTPGSKAEDSDPSISPNGKQIAFVSDRTGAPLVYVMNADGSGVRALGGGGAQQSAPAWSADGKKIAFGRCNTVDPDSGDCTAAQIVVVNADGSGAKALTSGGGNVDDRPAWAPNGKSLAFQRTNASGDISLWSVTYPGAKAKKLFADGSTIDLSPSYSPDGKQIAFASDATGKESIFVVNANGHSVRKLATESPDPTDPALGAGTENPAFAPSGTQVVYSAGGDLWIVNISGKNATQLTHDGGDDADWGRG